MTAQQPQLTLIGAGLNGALLAVLLRQRGFEVEIYERRSDMRKGTVSAGRSINLALSTRGIHALKEAALWQTLQPIIIPMKGRMMHALNGELSFQPYGQNETDVINSISRAELNIALLNAAEEQGAKIHFQQRCTGFSLKTGSVHLKSEHSNHEWTLENAVVIGCDGSASALRTEMLKVPRFDYSQHFLDYGYKELTIPASSNGTHLLEASALHIWPRGNYMLIALPNIDGTFACILFLPYEGSDSFSSISTDSDVLRFFETRFPDALRFMPNLAENYFTNPTGGMVTVKCFPWHVGGKALLLGDAAHAIVPFFGQGINCGFEDCTALIALIDRHGTDWPVIFADFEQARKSNTDAIADMAVENFTEMRDRVADPKFLFRKKIELALQARYPQKFVPKYSMVTFHRVPYSVARARGAVQDQILNDLCESIERVEDLDWAQADRLIDRALDALALQ